LWFARISRTAKGAIHQRVLLLPDLPITIPAALLASSANTSVRRLVADAEDRCTARARGHQPGDVDADVEQPLVPVGPADGPMITEVSTCVDDEACDHRRRSDWGGPRATE
jgi:hypothetical protein